MSLLKQWTLRNGDVLPGISWWEKKGLQPCETTYRMKLKPNNAGPTVGRTMTWPGLLRYAYPCVLYYINFKSHFGTLPEVDLGKWGGYVPLLNVTTLDKFLFMLSTIRLTLVREACHLIICEWPNVLKEAQQAEDIRNNVLKRHQERQVQMSSLWPLDSVWTCPETHPLGTLLSLLTRMDISTLF